MSRKTIEYAGPDLRAKRSWRWVLYVFLVIIGAVGLCLIGYRLWPSLVLEPSMRARAARDLMAETATVTLSEGESTFPLDQVVVVNGSLRFLAVSNSHHNRYMSYGGSTYVNVNNQLYHRAVGHCGPSFDSPIPITSHTTQRDLAGALLQEGYKWIGKAQGNSAGGK